jgi:hypothetical protein
MVCTRPDLASSVGILSRFLDCSDQSHWEAALRVLQYLKGTRLEGLTFSSQSDVPLFGFCDSDWAGDEEDNKSTFGWVFVWMGAAISWESKKQKCVALSSCEAEYYALGSAGMEVSWLWNILGELHMTPALPTVVYSDSQSAIHLALNPVFHGRSKHIKNKYHFIRDIISDGLMCLEKIPTDLNVADSLTKALPGPKVTFCRQGMGLSPVAFFSYWLAGISRNGPRLLPGDRVP